MQTFVRVAQSGQFTAAAETLGLPKASVSQRVSALEAHLGVRLLQRTTRRVSLTEDGQAYLTHCMRLLDEIEAVEGSLRGVLGQAHSPRGQLRIDTLPSIARWVMAPALPDWLTRFPDLALRIGSSERVLDLLEEGVDCAVRGGELPSSSLVAKRLCLVQMGLYASPAYLSANPRLDSPEDLRRHHGLLSFQQGVSPGVPDGSRSRSELHWLPARFAFNEGEAAVAACVAGVGVVLAPPFSVEQEVRAGRLKPVLPNFTFGASPLSIVYPAQRHLSPRLRCFVDWFSQVAEQHPSLNLSPLEAARAWGAMG